MWVRLKLDFGWSDLVYGFTRLLLPTGRAGAELESHWSPAGNALAVLSVRSGLDLLLGAVAWPTGSEIVYSALNIPDMTMVARQHGIVPVPADLDVVRLAPNIDLLAQAITPNTRAILVAHLYGSLVPMEPIIALARERGLMVIEDCAENYDGVYTGHPDADVSLFSFGPLKTATALAGGVLRAKDPELLARLRGLHDSWPRQSRWDYCKRLCKYGTMRFFGSKWIYSNVRRVAKVLVGDVDKMIQHSAKSFRESEILVRLRQQPCGPLLSMMTRRCASFDHARIRERTANGRLLASLLRGQVECPGAEVEEHNYWLFPVLVTDPDRAIQALAEAGFDAPRVVSMRAIEAPADRPELDPVRTQEALDRMLLLPCYPGIPESELRRMAAALIQVESQSSLVEALKVTKLPADTMAGTRVTPQAEVEYAEPLAVER